MEIKSYSKYVRISPKKAREVARILPGKKATEGVSILKFIPRKAARMLGKTLQSAMANAENNSNLNADDLIIRDGQVDVRLQLPKLLDYFWRINHFGVSRPGGWRHERWVPDLSRWAPSAKPPR